MSMAQSQPHALFGPPSRNDTSEFEYADTDEADNKGVSGTRNTKLQEHFAKKMRGIAKSKDLHRRVAVLILSWKKEGEDYMDVDEEIKDLRAVFEEMYRFRVRERQLESGGEGRAAPMDQLNHHLAEFIYRENRDDPLLIVYYAGHGLRNLRTQDLELLGGNPGDEKSLTNVVWAKAEELLHGTKADKLVIFDCCYAGILAREQRSPFSRHVFEVIAATRAHKTAVGPGDDSFTRALIWALRKLAGRQEPFTTTTLMQCIETAPNIAPNQAPVCSERSKKPSIYKLVLAPLPSGADMESKEDPKEDSKVMEKDQEMSDQFYLHLTCLFDKWPQRKHIDHLAASFCALGKEIPLKQVLWKGLSNEDHKMSLEEAAAIFVAKTRRKSSGRKHDLLRIPPLKIKAHALEQTPGSTDAQYSDATLSETVVASPIPFEVPQFSVEKAEIHTDTIHADIHNQFLIGDWKKALPSLLLGLFVGVTMGHSRELLRIWRQR